MRRGCRRRYMHTHDHTHTRAFTLTPYCRSSLLCVATVISACPYVNSIGMGGGWASCCKLSTSLAYYYYYGENDNCLLLRHSLTCTILCRICGKDVLTKELDKSLCLSVSVSLSLCLSLLSLDLHTHTHFNQCCLAWHLEIAFDFICILLCF